MFAGNGANMNMAGPGVGPAPGAGGSKFNDILFQKLSNLDPNTQNPSLSPTSKGLNGINGDFEHYRLDASHNRRDDEDTRNSISDNASIHSSNNGQLPLTSPLVNPFSPQMGPFSNRLDSFNLPLELQGGVGNISSRRPSYAAESFTRSVDYPYLNLNQPYTQGNKPSVIPESLQEHEPTNNFNLAHYASLNNYNMNQLTDNFDNFNLNSNFNDFQSRRPSQLVDFSPDNFYQMNYANFQSMPVPQSHPQHQNQHQNQGHQNQNHQNQAQKNQNQNQNQKFHPMNHPQGAGAGAGAGSGAGSGANTAGPGNIKLDNGLLLKDQYLVASADLKVLFNKTIKYFQNVELANEILTDLKTLLTNPKILKLVTFIKNLNNLTFNHKILCLVLNKNGKFDLLSYPNNSNIFLQKNDLVIVDGDRGKDLVMILEPLIDLNFAILFNFLKKIEYLKSLNIVDDSNHGNNNRKFGGTHSTKLNASFIVNNHSNEDNEFIITLPTKQVLRFATPKEIHKISGKFLEEKKAFITCYNKIKELNLSNDLQLINVEYQSDFKKLIFYYYANFKRIDFRGLIKELFKIYKTRIWLCAVLPHDNAKAIMNHNLTSGDLPPLHNSIPLEYNLSNDQILDFSISQFDNLPSPNYFHSKNFKNLVDLLKQELDGTFYGFNGAAPTH